MNSKLFWQLNRAVCLGLWGYLFYIAAKKKNPTAPLILLGLHTSEYFTKGRAVGEAAGIDPVRTALLTLTYGFTWWVPTKKGI